MHSLSLTARHKAFVNPYHAAKKLRRAKKSSSTRHMCVPSGRQPKAAHVC